MSINQQFEQLDVDIEELVEDISRNTIPGPTNSDVLRGLQRCDSIVQAVIDDLNNWFYILDVRVYNEYKIGILMRYRWSIIRWAENDMDQWLIDKGWKNNPHLEADSRLRKEDELEARYVKEFDGVDVYANFMVHFPDIVFQKLNDENINEAKERKKQKERKKMALDEIIEARRGN